jgi:predicted  nucleic acid-binding Zn-ribbon protein
MGPVLSGLVKLQSIERELSQLRQRVRRKRHAAEAQEKRIAEHREQHEALLEQARNRRAETDALELDLKARDEGIQKLRTALNSAKTNKEYASILTQINTTKADDARLEEQALKMEEEVDALKAQAAEIAQTIEAEEKRLQEIQANNADQLEKLDGMITDLETKRADAAKNVPEDILAVFDRMAEKYEGEAMAPVEKSGRKPPYRYTCGGCYMVINAEHANALQTRDEVRQCDSCLRILYMAPEE